MHVPKPASSFKVLQFYFLSEYKQEFPPKLSAAKKKKKKKKKERKKEEREREIFTDLY